MSTTLVVAQRILRKDPGTTGDFLLYGSNLSEITEETEYIRKIRSTLAKIQRQWYSNGPNHRIANGTLDSKVTHENNMGLPLKTTRKLQLVQNAAAQPHFPEEEMFSFNHEDTLEKIKKAEEELSWVNKDNERLKIKLEASRAAGAESVKSGSQKLQENYKKLSEDLKEQREAAINTMKAQRLEQEQKLKQSMDSLSQQNTQLQEKYSQIEELEKRVQRMEEEKKTLKEKKWHLKDKLHQMMSNAENVKSCVEIQTEVSILQEQISHLDHVIHSQHQDLHCGIHQIEKLNKELKHQDERIEDLKEKIEMLQAKNKELKDKVEFYAGQSKPKVSKAVSTKTDGNLPYAMLTRLRK